MIKVYFGERFIAITSDAASVSQYGMSLVDPTNVEIRTFVDSFTSQESVCSACICASDESALLVQFSQLFRPIDAAGGLIENGRGEYLVIDRRGYLDLPKGKKEKGETDEENALREVGEETGIIGAVITSHLTNTYHTYPLGDEVALKCTHWYAMKVDGCPELTPQTEEDIASAKWVSKAEMRILAERTYASLKDVFAAAK